MILEFKNMILFLFQSSSFLTVSKFSDWLDNMNQPHFRDTSLRHHISFFLVTCIIPLLLGKILNEWAAKKHFWKQKIFIDSQFVYSEIQLNYTSGSQRSQVLPQKIKDINIVLITRR